MAKESLKELSIQAEGERRESSSQIERGGLAVGRSQSEGAAAALAATRNLELAAAPQNGTEEQLLEVKGEVRDLAANWVWQIAP